jgi:hypothetical protein
MPALVKRRPLNLLENGCADVTVSCINKAIATMHGKIPHHMDLSHFTFSLAYRQPCATRHHSRYRYHDFLPKRPGDD